MSYRGYDPVKRLLDVLVSALGLLVTAPLQAMIAVMVAHRLGRPVFFRQERPGRHGVPFTLVKFRTMREPDAAHGLGTDAERLTSFGIALRKTSLDELPTLWNVLIGDMSMVGPRPLLTQYLTRYTPTQARRHEVRPGMTGLAQVSGRNSISWEERFAADLRYVEERSLFGDIVIMARTVLIIIRGEGVSASGMATMSEFPGTSPN